MRSETTKNLDLSNEKHALIHIYWEWMDWNQEKRAFETEWAPWTPDAMILKSWIILDFRYFRSPCCWYSLFFLPKHDALRLNWPSSYPDPHDIPLAQQVHPENFRCIVAAVRRPGWFRHYQGLKRLASAGSASTDGGRWRWWFTLW